jgi:hypothetical protein
MFAGINVRVFDTCTDSREFKFATGANYFYFLKLCYSLIYILSNTCNTICGLPCYTNQEINLMYHKMENETIPFYSTCLLAYEHEVHTYV